MSIAVRPYTPGASFAYPLFRIPACGINLFERMAQQETLERHEEDLRLAIEGQGKAFRAWRSERSRGRLTNCGKPEASRR